MLFSLKRPILFVAFVRTGPIAVTSMGLIHSFVVPRTRSDEQVRFKLAFCMSPQMTVRARFAKLVSWHTKTYPSLI
jgi:hypothetical protein